MEVVMDVARIKAWVCGCLELASVAAFVGALSLWAEVMMSV
jgi:hypothetical protein